MNKRKYPIFYSNEQEDDTGSGRPHVRTDVYGKVPIERRGAYAVFSNILYYTVIVPLIWPWSYIGGLRVKGKEKLKPFKRNKESYFIFANHAGVKDVTICYLLALPTRLNTIGYSDALDGVVTKRLVPALGFIPLPEDVHKAKDFFDAIKFYIIDKKQPVCIYPEAHIWAQYTGVRDFKRASFRYPANLNKPVIPVFFARRVRKGLWKLLKQPRITVLIGDPIYPDPQASEKENAEMLGDKCYESLVALSKSIPQENYRKYVYRPNSAKEGESKDKVAK